MKKTAEEMIAYYKASWAKIDGFMICEVFLRQSTCFLLIMGIAREFAWDQASTAVADRVANCDVVIPWEAISNILYTSIYFHLPPMFIGQVMKIGEWVYSTLHKSNPGNVPMLDHIDHPLECFFGSVENILIIIPRMGSLSGCLRYALFLWFLC